MMQNTEEKKILFDTGQSGAFVGNADLLGIDLASVDMVVLSHGHYDHTGGVPKLLPRIRKKCPVYVGKEFFYPKYKRLEDGSTCTRKVLTVRQSQESSQSMH